jgi:hypothetical protein
MESRLFTKAGQAHILREFVNSRGLVSGHPGSPYTPREMELAEEIKRMNNSRYWFRSSETLRVAAAAD